MKAGEKPQNMFNEYTSNIDHILIPLPGFQQYHQTNSDKVGDYGFVGRRTIISKLKNWISNEKTLTGAYLITGFRGMGKSSFVGKALYELVRHQRCPSIRICFDVLGVLFPVWTIVSCILVRGTESCTKSCGWWLTVGLILLAAIVLFCMHASRLCHKRKGANTEEERDVDNGNPKIQYIPIHINIGNELLSHNDEILRLIVKSVHDGFTQYANHPERHCLPSFMALCLHTVLTTWIVYEIHPLQVDFTDISNNWIIFFTQASDWFLKEYRILAYGLAATIFYGLMHYAWKKACILASHFSFPTLEGIKENIHHLYLRSIAAIDEDYSSVFQRIPMILKKKKFDRASVREMEQSLVEIFEEINSLRFHHVRFVFVMDELDKVETPEDELLQPDENDGIPAYELSASGFSGTMNARKRKKELMKTLGNMKYFLSTVKAKFIFIAGRELYDAYLADVSDREFAISSVFDGVINVNSFFKYGDSSADITAMAEQYICQFLFAPGKADKPNLADYHRYANKTWLNKEKRNFRNTSFLYQYVMYLAYMSNGSPKKIAVYFEKDIRSREYLTRVKKYVLEDDYSYYLSFGIKDIQKIGFIHYLAYPIMQAMISKSKIYEDRLLVSTSFMISHVFKYHNIGFSWRNLEHIPELLDMNRTPELRDFLSTIIALLGQTHLATVQSGLYQFKFPMKISEEISFLSKRIEDISALFHFSKDGSLPVKRHYMHLLEYYTSKRNRLSDTDLHALASIHHILADIYLADEDYSQAIYEYQTGLQLVVNQIKGSDFDKDAHWISNMLFIVRNMLKLGVAYEKRKTFDSAYTTYSELGKRLIDYRLLDEKALSLKYKIENDASLHRKAVLYKAKNNPTHQNKGNASGWESDSLPSYAFQADHLGYELSRILSPEKYAVLMRQSFFYDLRLAYLPTLAKLSVLEKMETEGITRDNLELAESEFFYLHVFVNDSDKPMIYSDFFQKLGDILYYKNGLTKASDNNLFRSMELNGFDLKCFADKLTKELSSGFNVKYFECSKKIGGMFDSPFQETEGLGDIHSVARYISKKTMPEAAHCGCTEKVEKLLLYELKVDDSLLHKSQDCMRHRNVLFEKGRRLPCYACKYYNLSFDSIIKRILNLSAGEKGKSKAVGLMLWLIGHGTQMASMQETHLTLIANTLKGLANVMLGCSDDSCKINRRFLEKLFASFYSFYEKGNSKECNATFDLDDELTSLEKSILLYMEAGIFFDKAGSENNAVLMFRQILEILNFYLRIARHLDHEGEKNGRIDAITAFLTDIERLVNHIITILYRRYDSVNMLEIEKMKDLFGKDIDEDVSLHKLPLSPDVEELIYRYLSLRIRCKKPECIKDIYSSNLMGRYKQINTLSQNIQNLRFKFLMNETIFDRVFNIRRDKGGFNFDTLIGSITARFESSEDISDILRQYGLEPERYSDPFKVKIDALNFFVVDNLTCLAKIADILLPLNNPTLFISYFLGDINLYTEYWRRLYNALLLLYKDADRYAHGDIMNNREDNDANGETQTEYMQVKNKESYKKLYRYIANHKGSEELSPKLRDFLKSKAGSDGLERLAWNYNAELAVLNYSKAIEMHTEGRAYKDIIPTLYFLDDDLNNDTLQQQLAIERYLINSGNLDKRIAQMQKRLEPSRIFKVENYVKLK